MSDRPPAVLVFTGGEPVPLGAVDDITDAFVIAADSGIEHARAHGRRVDLAIGDFDSVDRGALSRAIDEGATVEQHPIEKDKTDFELALDAAMLRRPERLIIVGGHGGRLDHFLANVSVLVSDAYAVPGMAVEARMGTARVFVVRDRLELVGAPGELVTLLALVHTVTGITTTGLRYPLAGEALRPGSSRGASNEFVAAEASVEVAAGTLLVIQPGAGYRIAPSEGSE